MLFEDSLTQVGDRWCKRVVISKEHPMYDELVNDGEFKSCFPGSIDEKKGLIRGGLVYDPKCICPKSFISSGVLISEGAYVEESCILNLEYSNTSVFYSQIRGNQTKIVNSKIISLKGLDITNSQIMDSTLEVHRGAISNSLIVNSTNIECRGTTLGIKNSKIDGAELDYSRANKPENVVIEDSIIGDAAFIISNPRIIINSMIMGGIHNSSSKESIENKSLIWKEK